MDALNEETMATDNFKAKDLGLRAQKKLLGKMSSKTSIKMLIDDKSATLLDNFYKLYKHYSGNKKDTEKMIKCIIKITVKTGILSRNKQFSNEEMEIAGNIQSDFHKLVMTITSFYELDYSYDPDYLIKLLNDFRRELIALLNNHLTDKSIKRIDHVFDQSIKKEFLDYVFAKNSPDRELIGRIVADLVKISKEYE